ncbi:DUF29 domain-containing protein [Argonema galeatum]|uniref:DUF29 domain-containing protein n=1 Tax=Argonema galeatum TaxID=2942762 RepID=UPI002011D469|nr:DUF29 domain-containing protein [Argonema galeatum]MCL1463360.1 DUF29 domain-containing protein [Argonema galeatum A003/A1]
MTTHLEKATVENLELYEQDYYLWMITTANLLRERRFEEINFEHLIEEIEEMGKDKRRELKSRLVVLLMHILKYQYQIEKRSSSWVSTILEQYDQIEYLLEDSPSLKPYYLEIFKQCYSKAIRNASAETKLSVNAFPNESPFSPEDVINSDFIFSLVNEDEI